MGKEVLNEDVRLNYDPEGDVLYISFGEPQPADDSEITDDDIVVRTKNGKIVGLTILNARARVLQPGLNVRKCLTLLLLQG
jgi:uncharacterized protein YuzE